MSNQPRTKPSWKNIVKRQPVKPKDNTEETRGNSEYVGTPSSDEQRGNTQSDEKSSKSTKFSVRAFVGLKKTDVESDLFYTCLLADPIGLQHSFSVRQHYKTSIGSHYYKQIHLENTETRRRFLFDDRALRLGGHGRDLFAAEELPEEDINDVVDVDDDRIEQFVSQELVGALVDSGYFKAFIFILIVINSILIALQTDEGMSVRYRYMFSIFDQVVMATFVCEILLKWYYGFWVFWKAGWNILDFIIIAALLLGPQLAFLSSSRILRILRVMRAFRSLRSISALAGLSLVVQTILQSIPDMANIVLLLVIVLLVFGVSGVTLFGKVVPERFGDLPKALFSLFVCVTQDGWVDIYNLFKVQGGWVHIGGMLYFFCSIMVGAFVFANLVVAVVVTNLEMAMNVLRKEKASASSILSGSEEETDVVENPTVLERKDFDKSHVYIHQNPLQYADLSKLTVDHLSNYSLLLTAFEENLTEYKNIREDLDKIYNVVASLNFEDEPEEEITRPVSPRQPPVVKDLKGDIISALMKLEEHSQVNSRNKQTMIEVIKSMAGEEIVNADHRRVSMRTKRSVRKRSSLGRNPSVDH